MTDTPTIGDNSERAAKAELESYISRVLRVREEKKQLADDEKEIFAEAKSRGYDVKALRAAIAFKQKDEAHRNMFHTYCDKLDLFS